MQAPDSGYEMLGLAVFTLAEFSCGGFRIASANDAALELLGTDRTSLIGEDLTRVLPDALAYRLIEAAHTCDRSSEMGAFIGAGRRDADVGPVCYVLTPTRDKPGLVSVTATPCAALGSLPEVVQRQQRLATLGLLSRAVAHDANNLMTSIQLSLGAAQRGVSDASLAREHLTLAQNGLDVTRVLLRRVLDFSGEKHDHACRLKLTDVVADALNLVRPLMASNAQLSLELEPEGCIVWGDRIELMRAVVNLWVNASEALPAEGGLVAVSVNETAFDTPRPRRASRTLPIGRYVRVTIVDTGRGMSEEARAHAFEPFFTTRAHAGVGLGLAIVVGAIHAHGGAVELESEVGIGTRVTAYLPACTE